MDKPELVKELNRRTAIASAALERFDAEQLQGYFSRSSNETAYLAKMVTLGVGVAPSAIGLMVNPRIGIPALVATFLFAASADKDRRGTRTLIAEITSDLSNLPAQAPQ
jgi:hypothetical protein